MKVALCISGMLRTFEKCIPTIIEHVKSDRDVDPVWWETSKDNTPVDFNVLYQYKKELNIKKVLIDTYEDSDLMKKVHNDISPGGKYADRKGEKCNPYNFIPMIKKIEQSHILMLDNNVHYDIVVRMRSDLFFKSRMEFFKPEPRTVYMPERECWGPGKLNDQLIYGDGHTMSLHASLYRQLDNLYAETPTIHPESVLNNFYIKHGVNVVRYPIDYHIER